MADPTRPALAILGGAPTGRYVLPPAGELMIGSHASCPLRIPSPKVSPQHALLRLSPQGASLRDLGTPAGVFVNEVRVQGEQPLRDGDKIWLGTPKAQGSVVLQCHLPHLPAQVGAHAAPSPAPQPRPQAPAPAQTPAPAPGQAPSRRQCLGVPGFAGLSGVHRRGGSEAVRQPRRAPRATTPAATTDDFFVGDESAAPVEVTPEPEADEGVLVEAEVVPAPAASAEVDEFFVGAEVTAPPPVEPALAARTPARATPAPEPAREKPVRPMAAPPGTPRSPSLIASKTGTATLKSSLNCALAATAPVHSRTAAATAAIRRLLIRSSLTAGGAPPVPA